MPFLLTLAGFAIVVVMATKAFVGIDVAVSARKRLPISVCTFRDGRLTPLPLKTCGIQPPLGCGNKGTLDKRKVKRFAVEVRRYLKAVSKLHKLRIVRIAIDSPSDSRKKKLKRRKAEQKLDEEGVSCFATPSRKEFRRIKEAAKNHLDAGKPASSLPSSNQLWMLAGFAIFKKLQKSWHCIEVYPHAAAQALGCQQGPKSKAAGHREQLAAVATHTSWAPADLGAALLRQGYGSRHDKLDAFMAAWVASLRKKHRKGLGKPPDDVIWIPKLH